MRTVQTFSLNMMDMPLYFTTTVVSETIPDIPIKSSLNHITCILLSGSIELLDSSRLVFLVHLRRPCSRNKGSA